MKYLVALLLTMILTPAFSEESIDAREQAIDKAKSYFLYQLKDPDSAKFRNFVVYERSKDGSTFYNVCGEINAKNSYGGYVGFKPFYFSGDSGEILSDDNAEIFKMMYEEVVCR